MTGYLDIKTLEARYLLGELSEEEEKRFENHYFDNDRAFEELQIAEAEVIDAYVSNRLSNHAREHLEQRLAKSPRLRERVAFARTFAGSIPDIGLDQFPVAAATLPLPKLSQPLIPTPRNRLWKGLFKDSFERQPVFTMALAACITLVLLGGAVVIWQSVRLSRESQRLVAERAEVERLRAEMNRISADQNAKIERMASELEAQQSDKAEALSELDELRQQLKPKDVSTQQKNTTPIMAMVILFAGSQRSGGGAEQVKIPPGVSELPLGLVLETADYRSYDVVIRDALKKESFTKRGIRLRHGKTLFLGVPTTQLPPGTYSVEVSGVAPSGALEHLRSYQFRVVNY